jgi:hypothetical protein
VSVIRTPKPKHLRSFRKPTDVQRELERERRRLLARKGKEAKRR